MSNLVTRVHMSVISLHYKCVSQFGIMAPLPAAETSEEPIELTAVTLATTDAPAEREWVVLRDEYGIEHNVLVMIVLSAPLQLAVSVDQLRSAFLISMMYCYRAMPPRSDGAVQSMSTFEPLIVVVCAFG